MVVRKWSGGKVVSYFIFDTTTAECGATTTFTITADLYEVTSDASLIRSMPADIQGLEKCSNRMGCRNFRMLVSQ